MRRLLVIRGPSGSGKSTISRLLAEEIQKRCKKVALIPIDLSLSEIIINHQENFGKQTRKLMQMNTESLVKNFLSNNYFVIAEGQFYRVLDKKSEIESIVDIGKKMGAKTDVIELECGWDTIVKRIKARSRENKNHDNNLDNARKRYEKFQKSKYNKSERIDVSGRSKEEVVDEIMGKL